MNRITSLIRKNIGIIVSVVGLALLVILTFGDMGELLTEEYWKNVGGNFSSISALTIGLVLIQTSIKQGISEQALSAGLNTTNTTEKYKEHKKLVKENQERHVYLPYFLAIRNKRETRRRKREFLVDNNFTSEKMLRASGKKKLIKAYDAIQTNITVDSIKWSTTEIVYNKNGRIEKLETYRKKRLVRGIILGIIFMLATTFITGGLFLDKAQIPFWQKIVKLVTYLITISLSVIFDIGKNYEKGAFGVPNELEEINSIWEEFASWEIPNWVKKEVEDNEKQENLEEQPQEQKETPQQEFKEPVVEEIKPILLGFGNIESIKEEDYESDREESVDAGTDIQEKPVQSEDI
jgi:hypothetical protein